MLLLVTPLALPAAALKTPLKINNNQMLLNLFKTIRNDIDYGVTFETYWCVSVSATDCLKALKKT